MSGKQLLNRLQSLPQPKFSVKQWRDLIPSIPKSPKGPHPGCALSVRQMVTTFNDETGLTNVGGSNGSAQLIQNSATAVLGAIAFRLDDLAQDSTFASLFDQYRIDKVLLRFMARNIAVSVFNTASPNGGVPLLYITQDRDDSSAPASLNAVKEYDQCVVMNGMTSCDVMIEARPTLSAFAGGAFSGYTTADVEPWIDVANVDVPHYGVKFAIDPLTVSTTSSWVWDVEAFYYVSFRNVR